MEGRRIDHGIGQCLDNRMLNTLTVGHVHLGVLRPLNVVAAGRGPYKVSSQLTPAAEDQDSHGQSPGACAA